jgi:hypothetical protein
MMPLSIDPWICEHLRCLPATRGELLTLEICCIWVFVYAAVVSSLALIDSSPALGLIRILYRGLGSGGLFSLSILLLLYPISPNVRGLFNLDQMGVVFGLGAVAMAAMQLCALMRS